MVFGRIVVPRAFGCFPGVFGRFGHGVDGFQTIYHLVAMRRLGGVSEGCW